MSETARAEAEELAWRELVHDQLRSLRTGMALLAALGVVALGVALWALLDGQSGGGRDDGVSTASVRALERRVDDIAGLGAQQRSLERDVETIAERVQRLEQAGAEVRLG